ncbi:hypothetical protein [Sphingomonas sp. UYP23]
MMLSGRSGLFAFLRFVVEEALQGRGSTLKELVIGDALYGGNQAYDPSIGSTVRVEARRLRTKLDAYYDGMGAEDEVVILIPTGGYAPLFQLKSTPRTQRSERGACAVLPFLPSLAVLPFTSLGAAEVESAFAEGVTDKVIHAAACGAPFRVVSRALMFQLRSARYSLGEFAAATNSDLLLHATMRRTPDFHRISVELADRVGDVVWSDRIDIAGGCGLELQERIEASIMARLSSYTAFGGFGHN